MQLNTILFAKTLMRKDVATSSSSISKSEDKDDESAPAALDAEASEAIRPSEAVATDVSTETTSADAAPDAPKKTGEDDDEDFSSKSQIMTLMTTDVWLHLFIIVKQQANLPPNNQVDRVADFA